MSDRDLTSSDSRTASADDVPVWVDGRAPQLTSPRQEVNYLQVPGRPRPVFLNDRAAFVMKRCDGRHSVDQIIAELQAERPRAPRARLEREVRSGLSFLRMQRLIRWGADEDPRERFHVAGEQDYLRVAEFVRPRRGTALAERLPAFYVMTGPEIPSWYDDTVMRTRQFHSLEIFFILEGLDEVDGVASVAVGTFNLYTVAFALLLCRAGEGEEERLREMIDGAVGFCRGRSIGRLKLPLIPNMQNDENRRFLKDLEFACEGSILDEFGPGQHIELWSRRTVPAAGSGAGPAAGEGSHEAGPAGTAPPETSRGDGEDGS